MAIAPDICRPGGLFSRQIAKDRNLHCLLSVVEKATFYIMRNRGTVDDELGLGRLAIILENITQRKTTSEKRLKRFSPLC